MSTEAGESSPKPTDIPLGCREVKGLGFIRPKGVWDYGKREEEFAWQDRAARQILDSAIKSALVGNLDPAVAQFLDQPVDESGVRKRQLLGKWIEEIDRGELVVTHNYKVSEKRFDLGDSFAVGGGMELHMEYGKLLTGKREVNAYFAGVVLNLDAPVVKETSEALKVGKKWTGKFNYTHIFQALDAVVYAHQSLDKVKQGLVVSKKPLLNQAQFDQAISWVLTGKV